LKKKILVVDDEINIVRLLALRLTSNNYDVITAYDGYQCVQVAEMELPDLILLDIKMPLRGGIKAFETLQGINETKNIPVIFITAFPSLEVKRQVMDMGAEGFISKPYDRDVLMEKINTVFKKSNNELDHSLTKSTKKITENTERIQDNY